MLNLVFIIVGIIINMVTVWSIETVLKKSLSWKACLKFFAGIPIGFFLSFLLSPITLSNMILFSVMGGALGEVLTLFFISVKQFAKQDAFVSYYDDGSPPKFFVTGDKHRNFNKVKAFCRDMNTRIKDVLIVLGDAGFNYYEDKRDDELKREISQLSITLFCIHGNKEKRPQNLETYGIRNFYGGKVYYEPRYPNICFAIDGEIYTFEGKKYMVVGGAHSVDKIRCLQENLPYWYDEIPDEKIKKKVENNLITMGNKIYGMITHTCPIEYLPKEMFVSTKQKAEGKKTRFKTTSKKLFAPDIDHSTEIWLGNLEKTIDYKVWYCGHYHIDKQIDKIQMMYHNIHPLHMPWLEEK